MSINQPSSLEDTRLDTIPPVSQLWKDIISLSQTTLFNKDELLTDKNHPLQQKLQQFRYEGLSLEEMISNISPLRLGSTQNLDAIMIKQSDIKSQSKELRLLRGSDIVKIIQIYLLANWESVLFKDFQTQWSIDGTIGRFTIQAITSMQEKINQRKIVDLRDEIQTHQTIKWWISDKLHTIYKTPDNGNNTTNIRDQTINKQRWVMEQMVDINRLTITINAYGNKTTINYSTGEINTILPNWKNHTYPQSLHFLVDKNFGNKINTWLETNKKEIQKGFAMALFFNKMIADYIKPNITKNTDEYRPFHINMVGDIEINNSFSDGMKNLYDTTVLTKKWFMDYAKDYNSDYNEPNISIEDFINYLNDLNELQNRPEVKKIQSKPKTNREI